MLNYWIVEVDGKAVFGSFDYGNAKLQAQGWARAGRRAVLHDDRRIVETYEPV